MAGYLATYTVTLEVYNDYYKSMARMSANYICLRIYCGHIILWCQKFVISTISPGGVFLGNILLWF